MSLVDVASYWSPTGQVIILVLVELGGLGIVTSALLLFVLVARGERLPHGGGGDRQRQWASGWRTRWSGGPWTTSPLEED